jgi:acetyl-CoA carboxylase carboxyltransferase component
MRKDVETKRQLRARILDAARLETVAKRRKTGHWTAREQIDAFLDPGSFTEYGALARPVRADMEGADRCRLGVDHTAIKRHPIKTAGPAIRVLSLAPATPL